MGVTVDAADKPFEAPLELLKTVAPVRGHRRRRGRRARISSIPESYGFFKTVAELQKANVPMYRAGKAFEAQGAKFAAGHVRDSADAGGAEDRREARRRRSASPVGGRRSRAGGRRLPAEAGHEGRLVEGRQQHARRLADVDARAVRHQPRDREGAGLHRRSQREVRRHPAAVRHHRRRASSPASIRSATIRPSGRGRSASAKTAGRSCARLSRTAARCWRSARRSKPRASCSTCRSRRRCPKAGRASARRPATTAGGRRRRPPMRVLRDAFSSPARLMQTLRDRVADPRILFYCPGSLLQNEFDVNHPVAWGMPASWPVFFESDQAYRLRPGFGIETQVVSRYPTREHPAERLAARRGVPARPGEHRVVPRSARATS